MIIGHQSQWQFLKKLVENKKIPQAQLFSGPDSLGKKKVAFEFLKMLNCQVVSKKKVFLEPCQSCFSCQLIEKKRHPDLTLISPKRNEIQISQIRELQNTLSFRPQISKFQSVIIDEAQTLNQTAQNSLLKTLEDPPGRVVFLLITSQPEMLFETILSRCQILKFYPLSQKEMIDYFGREIPSSQLPIFLELSGGRPGRAISFLKEPKKFLKIQKRFEEIEKIINLDIAGRFCFLKNFLAEKENLEELDLFLEIFERHLRKLLFQRLKAKSKFLLQIKEMIEKVEKTRFLISQTNIDKKLALENLMLMI